jgi:hypothetical protein
VPLVTLVTLDVDDEGGSNPKKPNNAPTNDATNAADEPNPVFASGGNTLGSYQSIYDVS